MGKWSRFCSRIPIWNKQTGIIRITFRSFRPDSSNAAGIFRLSDKITSQLSSWAKRRIFTWWTNVMAGPDRPSQAKAVSPMKPFSESPHRRAIHWLRTAARLKKKVCWHWPMRGIRWNRWLTGPTGRIGAYSVPVGTQNEGLNGKIGTDRQSLDENIAW